MEPGHAPLEDTRPVEVARLQQSAGLVGPIVEDDRGTHAGPAIAVDRGHVRAANAVVVEPLVEGGYSCFANPALDEFANRVADHRRGDAGLQAEAIGQVRRHVVLAARDVNLQRASLTKWNDTRIEPMH